MHLNETGSFGLVGRMFANGPGDWGSIPGGVSPRGVVANM